MTKRVLTLGTFDTPHAGHINFLRQCEQYGELTVGLNSDEFIESYKGKAPLFSWRERQVLLRNLGYEIYPNNDNGATLIYKLNPDVICIGSDWARKDYLKQIDMTQDELDEMNIHLVYIPYTKIISTTEIKRRISESNRSSDH